MLYWYKRTNSDAEAAAYEGGERGDPRLATRVHGLHTKPRRFKALKVSDWEAERGVTRRRHGM